ncbi:MAG TPA: hypothetical protein VHD62_16520 [Opitutaceae bacterium]|nr:hypothetical protein [Opitutaceae bacterium]
MKTSTLAQPDQPRWSCRVVRGWRAIFAPDDMRDARGLGAAHVAGCAECQRYFQAQDALSSALRRAAPAQRTSTPAGLEERILAAVHAAPRPLRRKSARPALLLASATFAAAAIAAFVFFSPAPETPLRDVPPHVIAAATPANNPWETLPSSASALLREDPLQDEAKAVYADAQSAVRFLALNFLPPAADATTGKG